MTVTVTQPPELRLTPAISLADSPLTFQEFADHWLTTRRNLKPSTLSGYESMLRLQIGRFIGDRPVADLTLTDMHNLVDAMLAAGYKASTIQIAYTLTTSVLDDAVRRGLLRSNPARLYRGRERPRITRRPVVILGSTEITKLLAISDEPYRTLNAIGIFAGLRSAEARGLRWGDLDFDQKRIHVRVQAQDGRLVPPKTPNAVRSVVMLDPLPDILTQHQARQPNPDPTTLVFSTDAGKPLHGVVLLRHLRRALKEAGIQQHSDQPPFRYHDLRHTCASILIAARADVAFVARQLGHSSPVITLGVYSHLFDEAANVERVQSYVNDQFASLSAGNAASLANRGGNVSECAPPNRDVRPGRG